jgi:hypothetical protein
MSSSQSFDEAERFGTTPPKLDTRRKVTLTARVPLEEGRSLQVEHETGDHNMYVQLHEHGTRRIFDGFTAEEAEKLANALLLIAQKMREEEASR